MCVFTKMLHFSGLPYGEPQCFAYVTRNNEYLMLSCTWEGGAPRALLWWTSNSGGIQGTSEENSNILVLRSNANYSGKAFTCHAKHPLAKETKQCVLKLGKGWFSRNIVCHHKKVLHQLSQGFNMLWHDRKWRTSEKQ